MQALWLRLYRSTGLAAVIALGLLSASVVARVVGVGPEPPIARGTLLFIFLWLALAIGAAATYSRSSVTGDYRTTLSRLLRSGRDYCVVLRPFGRDGEIILPLRRRFRLFVPTMTMEEAVANAVRRALGLDTYAIVDQGVSFAPPGLTFMRASDDDWKVAAQALIRGARAIVLILMPGRDMGEGFSWEVDQILHHGRQSQVVIVLPPYDQDAHAHEEARRQARVLVARIHGPDRAELPPHTIVARPRAAGPRVSTWSAGATGTLSPDRFWLAVLHAKWRDPPAGPPQSLKALTFTDYVGAVTDALDEMEIELHGEFGADDASHEAAVATHRATWGPEAPIRAEIRQLDHRIRDWERRLRPWADDRTPPRWFLMVSVWVLAILGAALSGWYIWGAWQAGLVAVGLMPLQFFVLWRTARASLPPLQAQRRELQARLGCGRAGCSQCQTTRSAARPATGGDPLR